MAPKRDGTQGSRKRKSDNYVHLFLYDTGRWGAWVREPKPRGNRIFFGTHLTERLAARCQDRALLKMEMETSMTQPIKLNFRRGDYQEDEHMRNTMSTADFRAYLCGESRGAYKQFKPTACLIKFLAEERALGNLAPEGALAICAPQPASEGGITKSTKKKRKEPELKDVPAGGDVSADEGSMGESYLQTGDILASVAPATPSPNETRKRRIIKSAESVAPVAPVPQFPRQMGDWILSQLEVETLEALWILATGPSVKMN